MSQVHRALQVGVGDQHGELWAGELAGVLDG